MTPRKWSLVDAVARPVALGMLFFCLLRFGWGEEGGGGEKVSRSHPIVGENVKTWKLLMTIQGGGGLEAVRFGWYSVQVDSSGSTTVKKHPGLQGEINVFDERAIAASNATVIFNDSINEDQRRAVIIAASAAINNFELQPNRGSRAEDGWRVTLKVRTDRREVTVAARELATVGGAGDAFPRLVEAINAFLPGKGISTQ